MGPRWIAICKPISAEFPSKARRVFLLLWLSRVWLLASRGQLNEDPVVFALTDRMSLLIGVAGALPELGVKSEVHLLVAATENMPSGSAQRPSDVVTW